jgi:hypothetical protein
MSGQSPAPCCIWTPSNWRAFRRRGTGLTATAAPQLKNYGPARTEFAHVVIDDHSRLAYVEIHRHDRGDIAAAVLQRAATWMVEQGCGPVQAVMTDNALAYRRSRHFKAALEQLDARHILIPPRTPRWNGKGREIHPHPR